MTLTIPQTTMAHLRFFTETIGARPVGSEPYCRAAEYVRQWFKRAGLQQEELRYECANWQHHSTLLQLNGRRLPATANVFSPACDVAAPIVALCTMAELEATEFAGRIAILYGELSAMPLTPLNCTAYNSERDQRINRLLIEKSPAAVITVNLNPLVADSLIEDVDQPIASATVPAAVGLYLLDHIGETVQLTIYARRLPGQATTIIGRKDGPSAARVTLMAHYDTKINTPGAVDNGGGAAALLTLAELLSPEDLPYGLEFIAFGDEEYYAYSDGLYVQNYGDEMQHILAAVNLDGVGQRLGTNTITLMTASEPFRRLLDDMVGAYPGVAWTNPWLQSNHATFAWRGVPSIALSSSGVTHIHHQRWDTRQWLDEGKLDEVVALVVDVVSALQGKTANWTRGP